MNLANFLENTAKRIPEHIALRFEEKTYTFQELNRLVNIMANGLTAAGLRYGDTCILMIQSCPEFIIIYYALAKMGVVIVPINFLYKSHELSHIFKDSGAKGFIGMVPYLEEPVKVLKELPHLNIRIALGAREGSGFVPLEKVDGPDTFPMVPAQDADTLAILYTSGTTGRPKGTKSSSSSG